MKKLLLVSGAISALSMHAGNIKLINQSEQTLVATPKTASRILQSHPIMAPGIMAGFEVAGWDGDILLYITPEGVAPITGVSPEEVLRAINAGNERRGAR